MSKYNFKTKTQYVEFLTESGRDFRILISKIGNKRISEKEFMKSVKKHVETILGAQHYAIEQGIINEEPTKIEDLNLGI